GGQWLDAARAPVAASGPCAGDAVAGLVEATQPLDIEVDQLAGSHALIAARWRGRVDPVEAAKPFTPEPARDGGSRQAKSGGNRCPGQAKAPAQMRDQRHRGSLQPSRDAGGRACVV